MSSHAKYYVVYIGAET